MKDTIIIKSIFLFMCFWGTGIILLFFRPKVEVFWKLIAAALFGFYVWFFFDEIQAGLKTMQAGWYAFTLNFLKEFFSLIFVNLFLFWPIALVVIFYKADPLESENLLKFMCALTIVLWVIFILYSYFNTGIDKFLFENLRKMIPGAK